MNSRRNFLLTAATAAMGSFILPSGFKNWALPSAEAAEGVAAYPELVKTASDCVKTGEECAAHCQVQLSKGNTSFAKCDYQVHQMLAMTKTLLSLASMGSPLVPRYAAVCADACKSCAEACAEHKAHFAKGMHLQCKACMEACEACEKACRKVATA